MQAQEHFNRILDRLKDPGITMDPNYPVEGGTDRVIIAVNDEACQLLQYTREELIGQPLTMIMPKYHQERHDGYVSGYMTTGKRKAMGKSRIVVGQRKDGCPIPLFLGIEEVHYDGRIYFNGFLALADQRY